MKSIQKIKNYILGALIIAVIGLSYFSIQSSKKVVDIIEEGKKIEQTYEQVNRDLQFKLNERDLVIGVLKDDKEEYFLLKNKYMSSADYFKAKWETLVNNGYIIPETAEDSLKVCLSVSESLIGENTNLREVIKVQDSIHVIDTKIIKNLELNIVDIIIQRDNNKDVAEMWKERALTLERINKKEKRKSFLKGTIILGMPLGAALILLAVF